MKIIPENVVFEQELILSIKSFCKRFSVANALSKANACKHSGFSPISIVQYLVQLVFMQMSMYRDSLSGEKSTVNNSRDAVYRFLRSSSINWNTFLFCIAARVCLWVNGLTSEKRLTALALDDSIYERPYSKKTELVSRVYDHVEHKYRRGFRSLFLGWTDGATFIPLAFRHMASGKKENRYCEARKTDGRTCGGRAKSEAVMKSPDVALRMLRDAKKYGIPAEYVLYDSWFTNPEFVVAISGIGYHSVGRLKNGKTRYLLDGKPCTLKEIYKSSKKKRGRSKYLLSVTAAIQSKGGVRMDVRIVFVRDRSKKKNWIAFLCTDLGLSEEQIIELYGKRWGIEVFFKTCKGYLKFTGEFQQTSYESITAHTSIVALRYMIFAVEQRQNVDLRRTPGDLFYLFTDEAKDIEFLEVITVLISELTKLICGITRLADNEVRELMDKFFQSLPSHIRCLTPPLKAA